MSDSDSSVCSTVLLVSANVGSLFEDPKGLLHNWLNEFVNKVCLLQPQFIALHLQEVGGKTYENSVDNVKDFINSLRNHVGFVEYRFVSIFLDEDFKNPAKFTALGNLYFAHEMFNRIKIWNFSTRKWHECESPQIFNGNIETIPTKEKSKFPQHFFPDCKWSRKGFMRTRWELNGTILDFVNIHLFHDASNLVACSQYPSVYCKNRRKALLHTLQKFYSDITHMAPFFIFGDFNFRCDTNGVLKELSKDLTAQQTISNMCEDTKLMYLNSAGKSVLTIGKKEFVHEHHQTIFRGDWLKTYDKELDYFGKILFEYEKNFEPTYPFEEVTTKPKEYMQSRCPSWCDRILISTQAKQIIEEEQKNQIFYNVIGENHCMGDHKPVYLHFRLRVNQGLKSDALKSKMDSDIINQMALEENTRSNEFFENVEVTTNYVEAKGKFLQHDGSLSINFSKNDHTLRDRENFCISKESKF